MNESYDDIRSRIAEPPQWWDEHAVPRYVPFAPRWLADIYADECALVLIACQNCGHEFPVAMSSSMGSAVRAVMLRKEDVTLETMRRYSVAASIETGAIHYGDPPNIECCPAGPTMNCDDLRVLQFWRRERGAVNDWVRVAELERVLPDGVEQGISPAVDGAV